MHYRPLGRDPDDQRLGRLIPDDWGHVENYPLSALMREEQPARVPVVIGVNWYREFDTPQRHWSPTSFGEYWIARGGARSLTRIRGGHCVCLEPGDSSDTSAWHIFYNQGSEGSCVGYGWSRCMSLLNKRLYAAKWLWDRSKEVDEWTDTNPGDQNGTSVRAAANILAARGHVTWASVMSDATVAERSRYGSALHEGIAKYRWARSVDEVHAVLANPAADRKGAVPILNSWGAAWPRRVWMPDDVLDRLLREDGEICVPTDR